MPRFAVRLILVPLLAMMLAGPAQAECYVDYKAKQDDPLRLAYGVSLVSDPVCDKPKLAKAELAPTAGG